MYRDITVQEALALEDVLLIDVRSEGEYAEATIPGAINIPLLHDLERAMVGTTYRQDGPDAARRLGLKLASPQFTEKIKAVDRAAGGKKPVLFCWRGGERSRFMASLLNSMGYQAHRIAGGYKAYRGYVNDYLAREKIPLKAVVLHGLTGTGKTEVLQRLSSGGVPALDLEELARHRGSVYGKIGLPPSPSQKMFEGNIVSQLCKFENYGVFVVECESRRVGNLILPQSLMNSMAQGRRVLLYTSLQNRVDRIKEIYTRGPGHNVAELQKATASLARKLGHGRVAELNALLEEGDFDSVFSFLLTKYYDPLYKYPDGPSAEYDLSVETSDINNAALAVEKFVMKLPEYRKTDWGDGGWKSAGP